MVKKKSTKSNEELNYIYPDDIPDELKYLNPNTCLVPTLFVKRGCHYCDCMDRCVYINKYQYDKLKLK